MVLAGDRGIRPVSSAMSFGVTCPCGWAFSGVSIPPAPVAVIRVGAVYILMLHPVPLGCVQVSALVAPRPMKELYAAPFRAAVRSGVGSIMCSYNRINGVAACENEEVLKDLKTGMGFEGWVMSDWFATHSTVAAANHGLDQEMPLGLFFSDLALKIALETGKVLPTLVTSGRLWEAGLKRSAAEGGACDLQ